MSAVALTALVTTSSAFGQSQAPAAADPFAGNPPAAMVPATGDAMTPAPGIESERMAPEAAAPPHDLPPSQAEVPTVPSPEGAAPPSDRASGGMFIQQQGSGDVLASSLIGSTVKDPVGESLGDINDVVLTDEGLVNGIVIGVGGFLGIGEKNVTVDFNAIERTVDADGNIVLTLNTTAEELESAPQYVTVEGLRQEPGSERNPLQEHAVPAPGQ